MMTIEGSKIQDACSRNEKTLRLLIPRIFVLVCLISFVHPSTQSTVDNPENAYENITSDPNVLIRFLEAQTAHATEADIIPFSSSSTTPPPGGKQYRIKRCKRANVAKCVRSGTHCRQVPLVQALRGDVAL